jgi:hypothetical protein
MKKIRKKSPLSRIDNGASSIDRIVTELNKLGFGAARIEARSDGSFSPLVARHNRLVELLYAQTGSS